MRSLSNLILTLGFEGCPGVTEEVPPLAEEGRQNTVDRDLCRGMELDSGCSMKGYSHYIIVSLFNEHTARGWLPGAILQRT